LNEPALEARGLTKLYGGGYTLIGRPRAANHAVSDVALSLCRGETLGIVGESGCGKSTLARMLAGLTPPSAGTVSINGQIFAADRTTPPRAGRRTIQYVFQDPNGSLNSTQDGPQYPRDAAHSPGAARSQTARRAPS
jgi:peptide/nickel transport system ATP-binding protein